MKREDWLKLIDLVAPAVGTAIAGGGGTHSAFWEGYQGQRTQAAGARQEQAAAEQRKAQAAAEYLSRLGEHLNTVDDPNIYEQIVSLGDTAGAKAYGYEPGTVGKTYGVTLPPSRVESRRQKQITEAYPILEKTYGERLDDPEVLNSLYTFPDGTKAPFRTIVQYARGVDEQGQIIPAPKKAVPPPNLMTGVGPTGRPTRVADVVGAEVYERVPTPDPVDPMDAKLRQAELDTKLANLRKLNQEIAGVGAAKPGAAVPQVAEDYTAERQTRMRQSVDELEAQVGPSTVGLAAWASGLPTSKARYFKAQLDTLKANIGFNELTEMRAASKTGGALGNVSDTEIRLLTATLGALDQGTTAAQFKAQLAKIRASLDRWEAAKARAGRGPALVPSHPPASQRAIDKLRNR